MNTIYNGALVPPPPQGMQTPYLTLGQTKELDLGIKEKPDYFCCKATVCYIRKENCMYKVSRVNFKVSQPKDVS